MADERRTTGSAMKVMGVVNITPDSFVSELRTPTTEAAIRRCSELVAQGASIVDLGGESTRPGAQPLTIDEELNRVIPVIEAVAPTLPDSVTLSIDTRHEPVARAAVAAGATIINDMSATLGSVAGDLGVGYIVGHMQGTPPSMQQDPHYDDVVDDVLASVTRTATAAIETGVREVWIDPGIGFGKTIEHNLALLANIDRFVASPFPVLLGVSRKSTIGHLHAASDLKRPLGTEAATSTDDRLEGSLAVAAWAGALGVDILRVHDVSDTVQALQVVAARNRV